MKKVRHYQPAQSTSGPSTNGRVSPNFGRGTNCTGEAKEVVYDNQSDGRGGRYVYTRIWLDSCQTNELKLQLKAVAAVLGAVGAKIEWTIGFTWVVGGLLYWGSEYLGVQQSNSSVNAVWVKDHDNVWTAGPQRWVG